MADDKKQLVQDLNDEFSKLQDSLNNISNDLLKSMRDRLSDLAVDANEFIGKFEKGQNVVRELNTKLVNIQKDVNKLGLERLKKEHDLAKALRDNDRMLSNRLSKDLLRNKLATQQIESTQTLLVKLLQAAEAEARVTKEKEKQNSLGGLARKIYEDNIKNSLTLFGIFKFILDASFKANRQVTDLGKALGISTEAAKNLRQEWVKYSRNLNDSFINTDRLFKAQMDLSNQLGISVAYSSKELEIFARLTDIVGLTADEAGKLAKFSAASGIEIGDYVKDLRASAFYAQQATKTHFSDKQVLQDISKLSAGILIKFQGTPKAIADAVVQAKALGTSLEQVDKIGESLLNWESSIESELQAELITGKKLNFERARAASLTGDQVELMQEMTKQAGSLSDYQHMNVIAQQSLAQAFGMGRDEMADMLMKQEAINKYGDKAAILNKTQIEDMKKQGLSLDEYLAKQDEQRSIQEKFNDAVLKLQDIIGNLVAGPVGSLLNGFANIASSAAGIYTALIAIGGISFGRILASLATMATELGLSAAGAITTASAITLGIGAVAVIAGIAAAMGAFGSAKSEAKSMNDGVVGPNGKILYTGAEGAIKLNDNDSVIAGTNLGKGGNDLTPLIAAINEVRNAVNSSKGSVYLDGERVGTMVGRRKETGTEQNKNSYQLA